MTTGVRIFVEWTGLAGSPWLQQFNFTGDASNAAGANTQVGTFLNDLKPFINTECSWTTGANAVLYTVETGETVEDVPITPQAGTGTETNDHPLPGNVCLNLSLSTGVRRAGRQIQGHIYLPGVSGNALNNQGQWSTALLTAAATAANAFGVPASTPGLAVYSRPRAAISFSGELTPVSSIAARAVTASLRSRRD